MLLNDCIQTLITNFNIQKNCIKNNIECPFVYLSGPPGIGKSSLFEQIAIELNMNLNVQYISTMLVEQFGLPTKERTIDNIQKWTNPELFSTENLRIHNSNNEYTILLLDDLHLANKTIQKYCFQLFTYRSIHNRKMPDNFLIASAGNQMDDHAGAEPIMAPIINRLKLINVTSEYSDWLNNFAIKHNVNEKILSFLDLNKEFLLGQPLENIPWSSPRSWTYLSQELNYLDEQNINLNNIDLTEMCQGYLNEEHANQFVIFCKLYSQFNFNEIINSETKEINNLFDDNIVTSYIIVTGLINYYFKMDNKSKKHTDNINFVLLKLLEGHSSLIPLALKIIISKEKEQSNLILTKQLITNKQIKDVLCDFMDIKTLIN